VIPVMLGLGSLIAKAAAVAVIPRVIQALSALGGPTEPVRANPSEPTPETVSAPVQQSEKLLYKKNQLTDHNYRYSTYGERTKVGGDLDSDWGYAGLFHHGPSGLDLATYRTYDSKMGRWISRDPLGEGVDYNLYRYCGNSPINFIDPSGLAEVPQGTIFQGIVLTYRVGERIVTSNPEVVALFGPEAVAGVGLAGLLTWIAANPGRPCPPQRSKFGPLELPGFPSTNRQPFIPPEYYRQQREQRSPRESGPFTIRFRWNPDGTLHQATTYDQFGRRANQFDFSGRHGEEVHPFVYPPSFSNPAGRRTHPGTPLNQHGL